MGSGDDAETGEPAARLLVDASDGRESKELIAGYAICNLPSKAAAIEWAMRFGEVVKVNEVDIRQME